MITAVDTNVLIDVFAADSQHGAASRKALADSVQSGQIVACEVVWAETVAAFPNSDSAAAALAMLDIGFSPLDLGAADLAGRSWQRYRRAGGPRTRVVADFLIGAHAVVAADRLLTRDRGFYRTYFADLDILDPSR